MTYLSRIWSLVAVAAVLAAAPGCMNLSRQTDPTRFYVLGGAWQEAAASAAAPGLSLGMRPLQLAAYLQTPLMVTRQGTHQVRFAEFHRWGEALDRGINRSVAGHLKALPDVERVDVVPWPRAATHHYEIALQVLRFEGVVPEGATAPPSGGAAPQPAARGQAHLLATWEVLDPADGTVLASGTTDYLQDGWAVGDYDALAALLDAGLEVLALDLAAALRRAE